MSGLFSFESLSLILPAFVIIKVDKSTILLDRIFPRYNSKQIEFQFIELILKVVIILSIASLSIATKWTFFGPPETPSLLAIVISFSSLILIAKLSIDLMLLGNQNNVKSRVDPFVIMISFIISLTILIKSENFSDLTANPLAFISFFVAIFFICSNCWLIELVEAKHDHSVVSNMEKVKSVAAKNSLVNPRRVFKFSNFFLRLILSGSSPFVLLAFLLVDINLLQLYSLILVLGITILFSSPSLANSWAVVDSIKSPQMPLNQASVLLRFYHLSLSGILMWLIALIGFVSSSYTQPLSSSLADMQSVRDDVERLLITGEYVDAAKLIRGSGLGASLVLQYFPTMSQVSQVTSNLAYMILVIQASQSITTILVRRAKLELSKYI